MGLSNFFLYHKNLGIQFPRYVNSTQFLFLFALSLSYFDMHIIKNSFSHCFPTLSWQKDESANSKLFHTPPFNIKYIPGKSLRRVSTSFGHMPLFTYLMRNLVCRFDENPFANQLGQGIGKTNETVCGQ